MKKYFGTLAQKIKVYCLVLDAAWIKQKYDSSKRQNNIDEWKKENEEYKRCMSKQIKWEWRWHGGTQSKALSIIEESK